MATAVVGATFVLALPIHSQYASASPITTAVTTSAAPVSSPADPHTATKDAHKLSHVTSAFATTDSPTAPSQPQTPVTSAPDKTWGIPTPILAASIGLLGVAAGSGTTALLFRRGRRHTIIDRAEDQRRQDALQQRIDARDHWKDEYEDIKTATSGVLALCVDAFERPLCQDDTEAQQITVLLRRLRITIGQVRGKCSAELTESLTQLCSCLTDLKETLLPARALLTDPSTTGQYDVLDLAARTAKQTRVTIQMEADTHTARATADTEWGSR